MSIVIPSMAQGAIEERTSTSKGAFRCAFARLLEARLQSAERRAVAYLGGQIGVAETGPARSDVEAGPDPGQGRAHRSRRGLASRVRAGIAAIAEWRSLRRAARDLESLDSRILKDIGISRTEIGRVVRYGRSH